MQSFFLYYILSMLFGNPVTAILFVAFIYLIVDRRFIGLLPDFTRPLRRKSRLRQLRSTVALNPANASAQLELGQLLMERKRYREALPFLQQAGKKLEDHASAQYYLGADLVRVGEMDAGREVLEKAVALRPNVQYGEPFIYLAEAALSAGNNTAELPEWVQTVVQYGNVEVCYRMGRVLQQYGYKAEAHRLYSEALNGYKQCPTFARKTSRRWGLLAWLALKRMPLPAQYVNK